MDNTAIQIEGVKMTTLKQINDSRGAVLHMFRNDAADFTTFGECYFSEIFPQAIKAWKKHTKQIQNIAVPVGKIRLVMYDCRKDSPTRGVLMDMEIGRPDSYVKITIPPQIWYGFQCISEMPALITNCANIPHDPYESEVKNYDDDSIPYQWNVNNGQV